MTNKVYQTAQGKVVDIGALMLQNENERAVGNMNVNARGDVIGSDGHPILSRNDQVTKQYRQQTNVTAGPIPVSTKAAKEAELAAAQATDQQLIEQARLDRQAKRDALAQGKPVTVSEAPLTGLAAALAAAAKQKDDE